MMHGQQNIKYQINCSGNADGGAAALLITTDLDYTLCNATLTIRVALQSLPVWLIFNCAPSLLKAQMGKHPPPKTPY